MGRDVGGRPVIWMKRRRGSSALSTFVLSLFIGGLLAWGQATAQSSVDLVSEIISAPDHVPAGTWFSVEVGYANQSSSAPDEAVVNLELPGHFGFDWDASVLDLVGSSFADSNGNSFGLYIAQSCDSLIIQVRGPSSVGVDLPAHSSASFSVDLPMALGPVTVGRVQIETPPGIAGVLPFAAGSCSACSQPSTCFGPRLGAIEPVTAPLALVDDGSASPTLGCSPLVNDLTGAIALVRRGLCEFGTKALNAEVAGAVGVLVMNDREQDIVASMMLPGAQGTQVTVPVAMIDVAAGDVLEAEVVAGSTVTLSLGAFETTALELRSRAFHTSNSTDADPEPGNDSDQQVVLLGTGLEGRVDFTWTPMLPTMGETVAFQSLTGWAADAWSWEFGDGGSSPLEQPVHAFSTGGAHRVELTATDALGSATAGRDLRVWDGPPIGSVRFLPTMAASAVPDGAGVPGTELVVTNPLDQAVSFRILALSSEGVGVPWMSAAQTIGSRQTRVLEGLSEIMPGALPDGVAAVGIVNETADLAVAARVRTVDGQGVVRDHYESGTTCDRDGCPGASGEPSRYPGLDEDSSSSAALVLVNASAEPVDVHWTATAADGLAVLGTGEVTAPAWGRISIPAFLTAVAPVSDAAVDLELSDHGEGVSATVATTDLVGGGIRTLSRIVEIGAGESALVPFVAGGTEGVSGLVLSCRDTPVSVSVDLFETGSNNSLYPTVRRTLAAHETWSVDDVVAQLFGSTASGALRLRPVATSPGAPVRLSVAATLGTGSGSGRTVSTIPVIAVNDLVTAADFAVVPLPGLTAASAAEVVLSSVVNAETEVVVDVVDGEGRRVDRRAVILPPRGHMMLGDLLDPPAATLALGGSVRVWPMTAESKLAAAVLVRDEAAGQALIPGRSVRTLLFADGFESGGTAAWSAVVGGVGEVGAPEGMVAPTALVATGQRFAH